MLIKSPARGDLTMPVRENKKHMTTRNTVNLYHLYIYIYLYTHCLKLASIDKSLDVALMN